jgi:hypothetical protein
VITNFANKWNILYSRANIIEGQEITSEASILADVEDTLKQGEIDVCLASFWKPITFTSNQGPIELLQFIKKIDFKKLNSFEKPIKIRDIDYYVQRPWNKKTIQDKVFDIIKSILSQQEWDDAMKMLKTCLPHDFHVTIDNDYLNDRNIITFRSVGSNVLLKISFEKR